MNNAEPSGKEVDIHRFVNSNHAGNKVSYKSRSGFLLYVNTALVQWFSKKQSTVETSVFDAEFVPMKQDIDAPKGIRNELILTSSLSCIYGTIFQFYVMHPHQSQYSET